VEGLRTRAVDAIEVIHRECEVGLIDVGNHLTFQSAKVIRAVSSL